MLTPLPPGTFIFNRYRVVGLAGQGPFGLTYLAQDQQRFDELCIVKQFTPVQQNPTMLELLRQHFHQSATALYELQHLQLPRFRLMFAQESSLYLVRDYVEGKSYGALLSERRAEGLTFSQGEVLQFLQQTLPILTYLHHSGLVHQNLSPTSLILRRQDQLPVLVDFGLVKHLVVKLQLHPVSPDTPIGQAPYQPPEQQQGGKLLPASDLYALGATAIALLTGAEPRELHGHWGRSPDWQTQLDLHPELLRCLKRMVHPNPEKRFVSAKQVQRALPAIGETLSPQESQRMQRSPDRQPAPAAAFVTVKPQMFVPPGSSQPWQGHPEMALENLSPPPFQGAAALGRQPPLPVTNGSKVPRSGGGDRRASVILVLSVALLVSVVSFRALSWVQSEREKRPTAAPTPMGASSQSTTTPVNPAASPEASPAAEPAPSMPTREPPSKPAGMEPVSLDAMRDRSRQLGIDVQFVSDLADQVFYAKYPDQQSKKLEEGQNDLRTEWTTLANDLLTKLESLSPATRGKLGSYQRADYDRWLAPGNGASLNGRELNVLVNNRFGELFPDQKGQTLNPKTFGQVWYAIAEEEMVKLKPQ